MSEPSGLRGSRAVLIGTGRYTHPDVGPIPAAGANIADLANALTAPGGAFTAENCVIISEPDRPSMVGNTVGSVAHGATDVLLVYYTGHGMLDRRGRLFLTVTVSDPDRIRWTAVPFETLREEIAESPAHTRILILDCCFAGRAFEAMGDMPGLVAGQTDIHGTYTIASCSANEPSFAPAGRRYTAFTEAMLSAAAPGITLDQLYNKTDQLLSSKGLPRPLRRSVNAAGELRLFGSPTMGLSTPGVEVAPNQAATPSRPAITAPTALRRITRRRLLISGTVAIPLATAGVAGIAAFRNQSASADSVTFHPDQKLEAHSVSVHSVAFHPTQPWLASGDDNGNVYLWKLNTSSPSFEELPKHPEGRVNSTAFNSDGTLLAAGSDDGNVYLWKSSLTSEFFFQSRLPHGSKVYSVAFHPTEPWLASGDQEKVYLRRNLHDGNDSWLEGNTIRQARIVKSVAFSSDGTTLAAGGNDKKVWLWELGGDLTAPKTLDHNGGVMSVALNSDGTKLASSVVHQSEVHLWNMVGGNYVHSTLNGHAHGVTSVAFHPQQDLLASGSSDGSVWLWDLNSNASALTPQRHNRTVNSVAFNSGGTLLATGSYDSSIQVWRQGG